MLGHSPKLRLQSWMLLAKIENVHSPEKLKSFDRDLKLLALKSADANKFL